MNKQIFFKWLKLNVLWFIGAFVVALLLVLLFPATMLGLRLWGAYTIAVGLMSAIEQGVVSVWHSPILIMILVLFGA